MNKKLFYIAIILLYFSCSKASGKESSAGSSSNLPAGVRSVKTVHTLGAPDKIEVMEFLWLGCPHCRDFQPSLVRIKKNFAQQANFVAHPATFPKWDFDSRVFLALDEMGLTNDGLLANYYEARQDRESSGLDHDINRVADWLKQRYEVQNTDFISVFENSTLIEQRYQEASELLQKYPVNGTPTVLISVPSSGETYIISSGQVATMEQNIYTVLENNIGSNS